MFLLPPALPVASSLLLSHSQLSEPNYAPISDKLVFRSDIDLFADKAVPYPSTKLSSQAPGSAD